ncbi:MAG: DUF4233 domain-containing protein [Propionibacteriaceae bacterium]|nr:DUF4233 domain-containing protein [Propionibacteriaceae bacterium]
MRLGPKNPMKSPLLSILVFEAVVFGLAIAGMIQVDNVPVPVAVTAASIGIVLAIAAAALFRTPVGYPLGWLTQLYAVGMGILTPWMYWVGGVFALLWVVSFVLGRRLEGMNADSR